MECDGALALPTWVGERWPCGVGAGMGGWSGAVLGRTAGRGGGLGLCGPTGGGRVEVGCDSGFGDSSGEARVGVGGWFGLAGGGAWRARRVGRGGGLGRGCAARGSGLLDGRFVGRDFVVCAVLKWLLRQKFT
jgi:hypothetical protein